MSERKKNSRLRSRSKLTALEEQAIIDGIRGVVDGEEYQAACEYEYCRESKVLGFAAERMQRGESIENVCFQVDREFHCGALFIQQRWYEMWRCPSFPKKPWNSLSEGERNEILRFRPHQACRISPLRTPDVTELHLRDFFGSLAKEASELEATQSKDVRKTIRSLPAIRNFQQWSDVVFQIDFSKSKSRIIDELSAWLDLPENSARLREYRSEKRGATGGPTDRLKELAAVRLVERLSIAGALEFLDSHFSNGAKFHDKRPNGSGSVYSDESSIRAACIRARDYMKEFLPFDEMAAESQRWAEEFLREISKKNL